jgi:hypothetical protein
LGAISCLFEACDGDEQGRRQVGDSPLGKKRPLFVRPQTHAHQH